MVRRSLFVSFASLLAVIVAATPVLACGGLINSNGSVTLVRTTTLAAYHDGIEHYVTSFAFAGGEGEFGSIIPLPDVPTKVVKGGDWTLQRLVLETQPVRALAPTAFAAAGAAEDAATVILKTKIDALDVTVLQGGATGVGRWATDHGFFLPPDAPEILDFYAERSPVFMAVQFDASRAAAQGLGEGDGTPIHVVIPTDDPWVPLRILGLGAAGVAPVEGDVYLLTDRAPSLLPAPISPQLASFVEEAGRRPGLVLERSSAASTSLLSDLRSDRGMSWLPTDDMWLTYLRLDATASQLRYDLAVDATGAGRPSPVDAGLTTGGSLPAIPPLGDRSLAGVWIAVALVGALVVTGAAARRGLDRPTV
jgi:Uncharacterized protein conserved in bacteria (DUF2330)